MTGLASCCPALCLVRSLLCAGAAGRDVRRRRDRIRHRKWTAGGLERFESQVGVENGFVRLLLFSLLLCLFILSSGISFSNDERG